MCNWRSNRLIFLGVCLFLCSGLIILSQTGVLSPVEGLASIPLNFVSGLLNRAALWFTNGTADLAEIQQLRDRNSDLEEALAQYQTELVELREIASDYQRLTDLLNYTTTRANQQFIAADVINVDQNSFLRTITINRGTRDGIEQGMPVVTGQGLVGRIMDVAADASRVLLITDPSSAVSARLQTTRVEGSVIGLLSGGLRMTFVPLNAAIQEGDLVITSGLGGNFPPDIVIGQVTSVREFEFELYKEAEVRSLNDFNTLEFVLVVTSFQPVDLSIFEPTPEGVSGS